MEEIVTLKKKTWPIMETFYTIQGEGFYAGRPAYFIRMAGCDVGCVWCDEKESWDATQHEKIELETLLRKVTTTSADFIVLTGGEPAMHSLQALVSALHREGKEVAIETSGCYSLDTPVDWYCFSPKKFKKPHKEAFQRADELKVVVFNKSDFKWAEEHAALVREDCFLYLQPEWSKKEQNLPLIIDYVKEHPKWKVSLQSHKYMNIS